MLRARAVKHEAENKPMVAQVALQEAEAAKAGRRLFDQVSEDVIVASAFDGIGGAREAWHRLGLEVAAYFSSEIDADSCRVTRALWPNVV